MDEMHIEARKKQTMNIMFEELSFAKREKYVWKNIKVVDFSATTVIERSITMGYVVNDHWVLI